MNYWTIHINDAQVSLLDARAVLAQSPGYAIVEPRQVRIGREAFRNSRALPRAVVHDFWAKFSTDPLTTAGPRARTFADLAFAHLSELVEEAKRMGEAVAPIVFAVPGNFPDAKLGLLLGVAQEIPLSTAGIVDDAIVAASTMIQRPRVVYVDVSLHGALITHLQVADGELKRAAAVEVPSAGLLAMQQQWISYIAEQFIAVNRFDPLHQASSEQQLYNGLDAWLALVRRHGTTSVALEHRGRMHRLNLEGDALAERVADRVDAIGRALAPLVDDSTQVMLTDFAARIPGLLATLQATAGAVDVLAERAVAQGVAQHAQRIGEQVDGQVVFTGRLPVLVAAPHAETVAPLRSLAKNMGPATHLLQGVHLYAITDRLLSVGRPDQDGGRYIPINEATAACALARAGNAVTLIITDPDRVQLNQQACAGAVTVVAGDELMVDGERFDLVRLVDEGA